MITPITALARLSDDSKQKNEEIMFAVKATCQQFQAYNHFHASRRYAKINLLLVGTGGIEMTSLRSQYENLADQLAVELNLQFHLKDKQPNWARLVYYATSLVHKRILSGFRIDAMLAVANKFQTQAEITHNDYEQLKSLFAAIKHEQPADESPLYNVFEQLSMKSSDALVNGTEQLDSFQRYLHVDRPIEKSFESVLEDKITSNQKTLTLIVGNVGDGKSHLLSYELSTHRNLFSDNSISIHNDATESDSPNRSAIETLTEKIRPFSDAEIDSSQPTHLIVAINMGVLVNLTNTLKKSGGFSQFLGFLDQSEILSNTISDDKIEPVFQLLTFRDSMLVDFRDGDVHSPFLEKLLTKITIDSVDNPFWNAYQQTKKQNGLLEQNYELLCHPSVQSALTGLIVQLQVQYGQILSARQLLNFIHDIIVPPEKLSQQSYADFLPMLLFEGSDRSSLLKYVAKLDPAKHQNKYIDQYNTAIYNTLDYRNECKKIFSEKGIDFSLLNSDFTHIQDQEHHDDLHHSLHMEEVKALLRTLYLLSPGDVAFEDRDYSEYLNTLANIECDQQIRRKVVKLLLMGIHSWNGQAPDERYLYVSRTANNIAISFTPKVGGKGPIITGDFSIKVRLDLPETGSPDGYEAVLDYDVYALLKKISRGYRIRAFDANQCLDFDRFVQRLTADATSDSVLVKQETSNRWFRISKQWYDYDVEEQK